MLLCMQIFCLLALLTLCLSEFAKLIKYSKNSFCSPWEGTGGLNLPGRLIRDSVKKPRRSK